MEKKQRVLFTNEGIASTVGEEKERLERAVLALFKGRYNLLCLRVISIDIQWYGLFQQITRFCSSCQAIRRGL